MGSHGLSGTWAGDALWAAGTRGLSTGAESGWGCVWGGVGEMDVTVILES